MKKRTILVALLLVSVMAFNGAMACTIFGIGKDATADGSTIVSHTCDSTGDDFRLWIIPRMKGGPDVKRDIVMNGNTWGDWSKFPEVKNYGAGVVVGEMPQPEDTYQYLHTNYSICNENGVAMGESTCGFDWKSEQGEKVKAILYDDNDGLIDCYHAQHIALERAKTAREAVEIMGKLVEDYGWNAWCECINICDGEEVWIMELYGKDLWCAVRIPNDAFFVCANRARIREIDFDDKENYLYSENIKSFAVENGLWSEDDGVPFSPADVYAPNSSDGCRLREWRAFSLVAPSLNLDENAPYYPFYVIPEKKISVQDVFELNSDHYQGTDLDMARSPYAGPFGDVISPVRKGRPINNFNATYCTIHNVKGWLPNEAKCLVWFAQGPSDTTYHVPLWASMTKLPDLFTIGNRTDKFERDSGWWTTAYVQQIARTNYESAIKDIHEAREDRMDMQYKIVDELQKAAAELIKDGKKDEAVALLTNYAYNNAVDWHDYWLDLGDKLFAKYMFGRVYMKNAPYPEWWTNILDEAPLRPIEEPAAE